MNYLHNSYMF